MSVISAIRSKLAAVKAESQRADEAEEANKEQARAIYLQYVRDSHAGKELDPDKVLAVIAAAGYQFRDFEQHVSDEQEVIDLKAIADLEPARAQEAQALIAERENFQAEVIAFNQDLARRVRANQIAIENNQREGNRIAWANNKLARYRGVGRGFASGAGPTPANPYE